MMKANKKVMAALLAAMMTVSAGAAVVSAGVPVDGIGSTIGTNANTGWRATVVDGKTYYSYEVSKGQYATGWKMIDGAWYFFSQYATEKPYDTANTPTGTSASEVYFAVVDYAGNCADATGGHEYRFGKDGKMITGWYQRTDSASDPTQTVGNGWEYYNANGARQYGWVKDGANWFFITNGSTTVYKVNSNGTKTQISGAGTLLMNGTYEIGGTKYTFAANGVLVNEGQGWVKEGNVWYYIDENGNKACASGVGTYDGWKEINGKWYYFDNTAVMRTGWVKTLNQKGEAKWYYCTANGDLVMNNWIKTGDYWYLVNPSGEMLTGWQVRNGKTYFLNTESNNYAPYGGMVVGTNVQVAANAFANFDANGALVSIVDKNGNPTDIPKA